MQISFEHHSKALQTRCRLDSIYRRKKVRLVRFIRQGLLDKNVLGAGADLLRSVAIFHDHLVVTSVCDLPVEGVRMEDVTLTHIQMKQL
jgi:hypothetical protein